ncbi:hypothetical protein FACS1894158_08190 [Betaproteobacteria bacterium]|nr:hypothetical protein FACS1894158_08190 [Betaproteobacteria bacterium]
MNTGKRLFGRLAIVFLFMMSMSAVEAEPWRSGPYVREGNRQDNFQPGRQSLAPDNRQRPSYQRNDDRGVQRQQQRLSPEERSRLRRDIREAGKEIYPPRHR